MSNEIKETELNEVAGGTAADGKYFTVIPNGWDVYQIKDSDCLSVLAEKYNTTIGVLMANNPMIVSANVIRTGYWMVVPQV